MIVVLARLPQWFPGRHHWHFLGHYWHLFFHDSRMVVFFLKSAHRLLIWIKGNPFCRNDHHFLIPLFFQFPHESSFVILLNLALITWNRLYPVRLNNWWLLRWQLLLWVHRLDMLFTCFFRRNNAFNFCILNLLSWSLGLFFRFESDWLSIDYVRWPGIIGSYLSRVIIFDMIWAVVDQMESSFRFGRFWWLRFGYKQSWFGILIQDNSILFGFSWAMFMLANNSEWLHWEFI